MAGFWKVEFFPSKWLLGTRGLKVEERGVYIDVLMMIYEHGGPIRADLDELARVLGVRAATAERLLQALVAKGKLSWEDGRIGHRKAEDELSRGKRGGPGDKPERGDVAQQAPAASPAAVTREVGQSGAKPGISENSGAIPNNTQKQGIEIQSNQGPPIAPLLVSSQIVRESADRPRLPAANDASGIGASDAACRDLIRAFDDAIATEWGEAMRRQMPQGKDYQTARAWLGLGVDAALVREVAGRTFARMHARTAPLPRMLSLLDADIRSAVSERNALRAKGFVDPERKRWQSKMQCFIGGTWLDAWGPKPGEQGCQMPAHLQRECLNNRAA